MDTLPWYRIVWACVWFIPALVCLAGFCAFIGLMHGPGAAQEVWDLNT